MYSCDASGQRVLQATAAQRFSPGTATAYTPAGQVEDADTSATTVGDVTGTRYYTFGGATVAVRTHDGNLDLVLGDEQGSVSVTMPVTLNPDGTMASATIADAQAVTRTSYTPYGQLRGADNLALDRGWLGQVEDRADATTGTGTGLTYLNARYYDPVLARFISPDPLMNPGDPKTLDPYRYADNNPVVFGDPSGLEPRVWDDGHVTGVPGVSWATSDGKVSPIKPIKTRGSKASDSGNGSHSTVGIPLTPPTCSSGFTCGSAKDTFYTSWYGSALGGLENWTRGFADSVIGIGDLVVTTGCTIGHGSLLTQAGRDCWKTNDSGGWTFGRIGSNGYAHAESSYFIGSILNPTILVGGGSGAGAAGASAASRAPVATEGIYIVTRATDGMQYVGQSGNITARLLQHVASGKFTLAEIASAQRIEVLGGKLQRDIAEQLTIDDLGGIAELINKVNPIGPKRFPEIPGYSR